MAIESTSEFTVSRRLALCTGAMLLSSQTPAFGQSGSEVKPNEDLLAAFISLNWFIDRDFAQFKPSELQLMAWLLSDDEFRRRLKLVSARFENHIPLAVDDGFRCKEGEPLAAVAFSSDFSGDGRRDLSNLEWCLYCLCRGGFIEFCHQPYEAVFADHAAIKTTLSTITSEYLTEWKDAQSVLMFGNTKAYACLRLVGRLREVSYAIESRFCDQTSASGSAEIDRSGHIALSGLVVYGGSCVCPVSWRQSASGLIRYVNYSYRFWRRNQRGQGTLKAQKMPFVAATF